MTPAISTSDTTTTVTRAPESDGSPAALPLLPAAAEGEPLGDTVGSELVGSEVGNLVGFELVGDLVGSEAGDAVGDADGRAVVGEAVGVSDGETVGWGASSLASRCSTRRYGYAGRTCSHHPSSGACRRSCSGARRPRRSDRRSRSGGDVALSLIMSRVSRAIEPVFKNERSVYQS